MPELLGFALVVLPFVMSPGASLILTLSNAAALGMRAVFSIVLGSSLGLLCHALMAGYGLQALSSQPWLLDALSLAGKLFLLYMGGKLMYSAYLTYQHNITLQASSGIKEAFALNVLNAKALSLYFTVVPAYAAGKVSGFLWLAGLHIVLMSIWLYVCAYLFVFLKKKSSVKALVLTTNALGGLGLIIFAVYSLRNVVAG